MLDIREASSRPILVTADDREPRCVIEALCALPQMKVQIVRLKLGDYNVDGRLIVERKSLHDFGISILDGRLFSQAARLAGSTIPSVLILEGTGADLGASGIRREALQGALVSISLVFRIPVLRSAVPEETAHLMLYCANQMRAAAKGALPLHRHRPKGKHRTQLAVLQVLPGVGPKRANALLEKYRTVEAVIQAASDSIQEIPGIGRGTAEAIRWAVTEAAAKFGP